MSVRIVTDSSCDLPESVVTEHGIEVVPLSIRFGDDEFIDREELSTDEFWRRCAAQDTLPETAAPAPGQFEQVYRRLAADTPGVRLGRVDVLPSFRPFQRQKGVPGVVSVMGCSPLERLWL